MPPNRPSNVRVQITRHAYYWFRQSPWWLNHQTKSSKSIKKVITYAHSTQKYSSPHANLPNISWDTQVMHIQHNHIQLHTQIWPNISWDTQVMHIQHNPVQLHMLIWPNISWDTQYMQGLSPKPILHSKKQTSKQPTFPTSCRPSGNQVFKQLFVLINKLQIHANYTSQLRMWPLFSLSNWQLCIIKCPTAQTV